MIAETKALAVLQAIRINILSRLTVIEMRVKSRSVSDGDRLPSWRAMPFTVASLGQGRKGLKKDIAGGRSLTGCGPGGDRTEKMG